MSKPSPNAQPSKTESSSTGQHAAKQHAAGQHGAGRHGAGRRIAGRRIACLRIPLFPLAARLRSEPELRHEALAVMAGNGNGARVVAATRLARKAGIRPGLTLPQARSRLPQLIARPLDAACEQAAQEAMLDIVETFSPRVEGVDGGIAFLDAHGLERHYPGECPEEEMARALILAVEQEAGLPSRVGVASSKLAARLAAGRSPSPNIIPSGDEAAFLAPLPLAELTPQAKILQRLESWGIQNLGDLAKLPSAEVLSRLGNEGQALHCIARGEDPQPLVPRQPPPSFREGMELEWPLINLEPFIFVARGALERLSRRLSGSGLACQRLELTMELEDTGRQARSITLPAPTRDIKTLLTLLRLHLEEQPPQAPILSFELVAHPDRPRRAQLTLFGPEALSPDKLATTVARLFALLGKGRVGSPRTVDGHCPERFALVPYEPPAPPKERRPPTTGRGLLTVRTLRPPLAIEVIADGSPEPFQQVPGTCQQVPGTVHGASKQVPGTVHGASKQVAGTAVASCGATGLVIDGRPLFIKTLIDDDGGKKLPIEGRVQVASGPWGLEEAWWSAQDRQRDYWDVELQRGGLYRIFRHRQSGEWFVDGVYD